MEIKDLILDSKALGKMGLADTPIYIIEYDLPTPFKSGNKLRIPANSSESKKREIIKKHKLSIQFVNKVFFLLKFKLKATKHLNSCWIIEETRLETAINELEELKEEMKAKGFSDVDKRIRIIPILTTLDGFEHYAEKKVEFLLEFSMEHIKYTEKGKKERKMSQSTLWRCKQAYSIVESLKEEVKGNKRYNEVKDTNALLGEHIAYIENMIEKQKREKISKSAKQ